jgi:hypothetical protein
VRVKATYHEKTKKNILEREGMGNMLFEDKKIGPTEVM